MNLAIFDLDNTLLDGDSDYNWGLYLVKKGHLDEGEYKEQNQKFFEEYQVGKLDIFAFAEFQFQFLKNNPRKFMKWLKSGKNVLYAIDQDYGWDHSVRLNFFQQEAATITTTKKIIDATNSNLLFINSYYENNKLILKIELIDHFELDSTALAQKINDIMEEKILLHPAEYLWMHRRFKSTLGKNFYK